MSKWIVKKTINENLIKNTILEETNLLHKKAIQLKEYPGGFSFFSGGKNFKTKTNEVVKLIGKKEDFDEFLVEIKEENNEYVNWFGKKWNNLLPGNTYKISEINDPDKLYILDPGINEIFLQVFDEIYCIRGSLKEFNNNLIRFKKEKENPQLVNEKINVVEKTTEVINEIQLVGPVGPEGPRGFPGSQGPRGDRGATGSTGPIGPTGEKGKRGAVGPIGPTGKTGPVGPRGNTGATGNRGEVGPTGPMGATGVMGPVGPVGPEGKMGKPGRVGPQGLMGPVGPTGPSGEEGKRGRQGPKGTPGKNGIDGKDGQRGPRGPKGPKGDRGPTGDSPIVQAKYPLVFDDNKGLFTIDKKFFEKLLSGGQINQQLMNKFINAASSGGGAVGIQDGNSGTLLTRSVDDIIFQGSGVTLEKYGKNVRVNISGGASIEYGARMFAGTEDYITNLGVQYVTGDFHLNTDTGIVYTRLENTWVQV